MVPATRLCGDAVVIVFPDAFAGKVKFEMLVVGVTVVLNDAWVARARSVPPELALVTDMDVALTAEM
jgi:hypothetical protein